MPPPLLASAQPLSLSLTHTCVSVSLLPHPRLSPHLCLCCTTPQVMDALQMQFADDSFDLVWACESGEHMPDKKAYVEEMARVLAPGGQVGV